MYARAMQRGVALLAAILVVALATIIAAAIAFNNGMTARRGAAVFAFEQGTQIAMGAEALGAWALREDAKNGKATVDFTGPWAQPLGPVEIDAGVIVEAHLADEQGRFNLNDLVAPNDDVRADAVEQLERILDMLGLESKWASLIADWIDTNTQPLPQGGEDSLYLSQDPPYRPGNQPLTSVSELLALPEFGRDRFLKLAPHVTALPRGTPLNLCTASGIVLDSLSATQRQYGVNPDNLAKQRESGCFPSKALLQSQLAPAEFQKIGYRIGDRSDWFRQTTTVIIGTTEFNLYSLLHRENAAGGGGRNVQSRVVLRSFGVE